MSTMASTYLYSFLKKLLPEFSNLVEQHLDFIVESLKQIIVSQNLVHHCLRILEYIIVENTINLSFAIKQLDTFPNLELFDQIRSVHVKIKYGNGKISLEDEIINFLNSSKEMMNYSNSKEDSLSHLRNVLSKEKDELKDLYKRLEDIRGFSEDCEKSVLHKLICKLVKMSSSTNEKVSFEAIKCLGELGHSNLSTLILQPEKEQSDLKCSPFQLLCGHIVSLLQEYIVDKDIKVVEAANKTLYIILESKEGRKAAESRIDYGFGEVKKEYINPYYPTITENTSSNVNINFNIFETNLNNDELWCPTVAISHENWITALVVTLLISFTDNSFLPKLIQVCKVKPQFCEKLLPQIINILSGVTKNGISEILWSKIGYFFDEHWKLTVKEKTTVFNLIPLNKVSVRCMLDAVNFVRLQSSFSKTKNLPQKMSMMNLKVAQAAQFCAAHFTALFYAELWCQTRIEEIMKEDNLQVPNNCNKLEIMYDHEDNETGEALQRILRNAYREIGDTDALPGCGISFLLQPKHRVEHYKELNQWDLAIHYHDMQISNQPNISLNPLLDNLKKCNLYELPQLCSKNNEPQYDCLWRLGKWDLDERNSLQKTNLKYADYEKYKYYSLKSLHDKDMYYFEESKKLARLCLVDKLKHTSLESSQNLYPILSQIQSFTELEDFASVLVNDESFKNLCKKWKKQDDISRNDFEYVEPVITQRMVMMHDYLSVNADEELKNFFIGTTFNFAELARNEKRYQIALRALDNLRSIENISDEILCKIQFEEAQIFWSLNDKIAARHLLSQLCKNNNIDLRLRSCALKLSGEWMVETYSENRQTIISDYFLQSLKLLQNLNRNLADNENIIDTYGKLAQFADREYQQVVTLIKSDMFQKKIVNMEKIKITAATIKNQKKHSDDEKRAAAIYERQSAIDQVEIENTRKEKDHFLHLALKYYLLNLTHSDENNIRLFRVISLFLDNRANPCITQTIKNNLASIPSHKFVGLLPQIIPHISDNNLDLFTEQINKIVEKCAVDHPHHTLPLILSLVYSNEDRKYTKGKTCTSSNDGRIATAVKLLEKLKKQGELGNLIKKQQKVAESLIQLAYYTDDERNSRNKDNGIAIPRTLKISSIKNYEDVLLPTFTLGVRKDCKYDNIVGISSFSSHYNNVGGINAPKRITCVGTDGQKRTQLVKGQDDLRQDAVMQQVFTIMNSLLANNKQTRNLLIRTYKIVPLSMRSGILEWVDNTMPIGEYLGSAHVSYRPEDKSPTNCRQLFRAAHVKSASEKLKVFKTICDNFKPVFHKFFESSFPQATVWYERRRAYIHSVATTSMCGYILGIGDRHVNNILIDKSTAEVIHIDFGIAFEQGRVLPTPETVPFRLTRDIVDGMGISGVEGIFRRSCEKTMEVLRQNSQTIITILEVLLYDPLYVWTVSPAEANKRQQYEDNEDRELSVFSEEAGSVNITAERALLRLRGKLQGTEEGNPMSIEHQVSTLIQQAVDPTNLCRLFHGWQPYL